MFNSIRIKETRNSGFRRMLIYQVRLKENIAILNHGLLLLNGIGNQIITEKAKDVVFQLNLKHISKCSMVEKNRKVC